jgi:hypothetical protein
MRNALAFVLITLCFQFYGQAINLKRLNITPGASDYAVVDLNNDNLPDIVGIGQFWDVELYMNQGDFKFLYVDIGADQGVKMQFSSQIGFIDMDKDGDKDIIHNCPNCGNGSEVIVYNNENYTKFTKKWIIATNAGSSTIYDVFDINKDGREDLVVCGEKANVYVNKDGNSFNNAMALNPNLAYSYVDHQDVNGDEKIDLIAKSATDFYIFILST